MVNQVSHPTASLSFFYMRSRCHISWQWNNDVGWRQHGEDMIISPLTTRTTLQLLLPCQLTCALHTWGINVAHDPWMYPLWVFNPWNPMYSQKVTGHLGLEALAEWISILFGGCQDNIKCSRFPNFHNIWTKSDWEIPLWSLLHMNRIF